MIDYDFLFTISDDCVTSDIKGIIYKGKIVKDGVIIEFEQYGKVIFEHATTSDFKKYVAEKKWKVLEKNSERGEKKMAESDKFIGRIVRNKLNNPCKVLYYIEEQDVYVTVNIVTHRHEKFTKEQIINCL